MNLLGTGFIVLAASLLTAPPLHGEQEIPGIRKEIRATTERMVKASIEGQNEALLDFYTEDAVSMPNYYTMLRGKEEIARYIVDLRHCGFRLLAMDFAATDVWASEDLIYEVGIHTASYVALGRDEPLTERGKYLTVWKRAADGSLKVKAEIWNADSYPRHPLSH
jgi:ketosteroid isomerase-like protein